VRSALIVVGVVVGEDVARYRDKDAVEKCFRVFRQDLMMLINPNDSYQLLTSIAFFTIPEAILAIQLSEGALDNPAFGQHLEPHLSSQFLHNLQRPLQRVLRPGNEFASLWQRCRAVYLQTVLNDYKSINKFGEWSVV